MKNLFTKLFVFLAFITLGSLAIQAETVAVQPSGTGTGADPWVVSNLAELRWISENNASWNDTIVISADIDATETRIWNGGSGWNAFGRNTPYFTGMIDGQGHVIRNLYINRPTSDYIGFVGRGRDVPGSEIKNLGIENCDFTGQERVGAIVGDADGKILNCYSSGRIIASANAGGIVGYFNGSGTAINCYSSVTMIGTYRRVGGFTGGFDPDSISMCYSCGPVSGTLTEVGGFHGRTDPTNLARFFSSYWDVERSGQATSNGGVEVGLTSANMKKQASFLNWDFTSTWAIVEGVTRPFLKWQNIIVRNNLPIETPSSASLGTGYVYNNSTGGENIVEYGYIYGLDSLPWITGTTPSHGTKVSLVTGASIASGSGASIAGATLPKLTVGQVLFAVSYAIDNAGGVSYGDVVSVSAPLLTDGSGTAEDPFVISTLKQLNAMNVDITLTDKFFVLANDIDAADTKTWNSGDGWSPINGFSGTFDGAGYEIRNLFIDRGTTDYVGLFGRINSASAIIKNLGVVDADVTGQQRVGALIGQIEDNAKASNCYSSGIVKGRNMVGGLIGRVNPEGYVENSFSTANAYGTQASDTRVAGFVGSSWTDASGRAQIWNCYSTGAAYGPDRIGSFNGRSLNADAWYTYTSGSAMGDLAIGAYAGDFSADDSTLYVKNYWDKSMTDLPAYGSTSEDFGDHIPENYVFELMGLSASESKTAASYVDWDFTNLWKIKEGLTRPYLEGMKAVFVGTPPTVVHQKVTATANVYNIAAADLVEVGFVFRSADLSWSQYVTDGSFMGPLSIDGNASISAVLDDVLEAGNYYSVQSYVQDGDGINYYGDASFVYIEDEIYDVTIVVKDESDVVVEGAGVNLVGYDLLASDVSGEVVFTDVMAGEKIPLIITKAGKLDLATSLEITGNETVTYNFSASTFDLRFIVKDTAGVAIEAATVNLKGVDTLETGANGEVLFAGVTEASNILYEVSLAGNVSVSGSKTLAKIDTVNIVMEPRTLYIEVQDKAGMALEGATVTLAGFDPAVTDADGMAMFMPDAAAEGVALEVENDGYRSYSGLIDIMNETSTVTVALDPTVVRFIITDQDQAYMSSVKIIFNEDTLSTSGDWGYVDFSAVPSGVKLGYSINKLGYAEILDSVTVVDQMNDTIEHMMMRNLFDMLFVVTDDADVAMEGAEVLLTGIDTLMTDVNGEAFFAALPIGDHAYTVSNGLMYAAKTGSISITDKDDTTTVKLSELTYKVTFTITDGTNPIQGANVTLSGLGVQSTDATGKALFEGVSPAENIIYSIKKTGYSDSINVVNVTDADVNITVALRASPYSVTFKVVDVSSAALAGATVSLEGQNDQTTDASGNAVFAGLEGAVSYTVSKAGYNDATGEVTFGNKDKTITVTLTASTQVSGIKSAGNIELYPIPATEFVNVKLQINSGRMVVYNLTGQAILDRDITSDKMKLDFTNQKSGIYMLKVLDNDGSLIGHAKIIIRK